MEAPERNLRRGLVISILIAGVVYVFVALVAVGNLSAEQVREHGEYALAVAAQPVLGRGGFLLIGLAALLSTASAINATLFGTARLSMVMARDHALPKLFSFRERRRPIPAVALGIITAVTLVFVNVADLTVISSFASSTFLLIFAAINLSAFRLRKQIGCRPIPAAAGFILATASLVILLWHLYRTDPHSLVVLAAAFAVITAAELLFSKRRVLFRSKA
jgi:amino acid transporter